MKTHAHHAPWLLLLLLLTPNLAWSWWNEEWASRKQITLDAGLTGADIQENLSDFPLLLRLHGGNFAYFAELAEGGKDLRFLADDKTPLKFHVEKFDALNEMALVWVKLPQVRADSASDAFWLYYGNKAASEGGEVPGTYDVDQALVYHFDENLPLPADATAYANHARQSQAVMDPAGWIGASARFTGAGSIDIPASPSLQLDPEKGWSFSTWLKIDQPHAENYVFRASEGGHALDLVIHNNALIARYVRDGKAVETGAALLTALKWQHVALVLRKDRLDLYLDGNPAGSVPVQPVAMNPAITLGGGTGTGFLNGALDEVQIARTARGPEWIKLLARSESPDFSVIGFSQDENQGGGETGHFMVIVQNVTVDGWVVIGLTGVMFVMALLVMVTKALVISRVRKDNRGFLKKYETIGSSTDLGQLDYEDSEEDRELADSEFLTALAGKHDHYQSSPLYHIYHAGVGEIRKHLGDTSQPVTPEALNLVRVKLDAVVVRENQRLNSNLVLLTIAIAGGPFLGLLGTVVGVMITFAVIAATGDVNINSIAPGIAAALLATVAGLAVAIPALFAYNYLLTQIKDLVADMRVFSDEFLALLTKRVADRQRVNGP